MKLRLAAKAATAFVRIVRDPGQLDVVFALVDSVIEDEAGQAAVTANLAKPVVAKAASARVRLPSLDLDELAQLPHGSFGEVAGRFFRTHGLDPHALPRRQPTNDKEWLSAHLYETHDLWHVLAGFGPNVAGELGLQAFYVAQVEGVVGLSILSAGLLNTLIYAQEERKARLDAISRGWQLGKNAEVVVGADWGALLGEPLDAVRERFGVVVPAEHDAMATLRSATRATAA